MASDRSTAFKPFVVLYGGNDFFLDRDIEKVRKGKRPTFLLDGDGLTDAELVAHCERYYEVPTTIILENAHKLKGSKHLKSYIDEYDGRTSVVLVAVLRSSKKLPDHWAAAAAKGRGIERKPIKEWDTEKYLDFIRSEAVRCKVFLDKGVAEVLLSYVGPDFYRLRNELSKLAMYVGVDHSIERKHIALITTPTPKAEPFQVAEAVMTRNYRKAINLFSVLYTNSGDSSLIPVVRALMKQVERSVVIKTLQEKGASDDDIATHLGMHVWPYKKTAAPIASKHNLSDLIRHMTLLSKLDTDVKGGSRSKRTQVETVMLTIAN